MEDFFPGRVQQPEPVGCSLRTLDANDWKRCIQDDCASWELFCLVHTNDCSHTEIFPTPILIRVEFIGQADSLDRDHWRGLIETIERDFLDARYEFAQVSTCGAQGMRPWKQWVIAPRLQRIQAPGAQ